ncbi:MAG: archaetidylserine decarboxylase [Gammaproteobacteria bacterium]|nr:archaetidylserine decarboxylase [Gammaproteobacteria bacterium]MCW8841352.1 archaetidylserine decarboxylase [Gammaproteobacteria bacterium]MCW8973443.1 archaetidylserine decarboxylase [Gammaproteobacteria bacterium]MCW8991637.1 archaetidylserine decarboxylase [Gammaproteobacteria bacterium]
MAERQNGAGLIDYIKALPQYLMPGHLVSRATHAFTRCRCHGIKNRFSDWFVGHFKLNMEEAQESDPRAYETFNALFTRALKLEARPIVAGENELACPVDGTVSQACPISDGRIFQAKGHDYSLEQLLGGSAERAAPFQGGSFATLYLSPRDYHRIHMPISGTLREMVHVPGRLFSVNPATTRVIPGLFARNERVVSIFDTAAGPMAMVKVGAVNVGSIETVWAGEVTPPAGRVIRTWRYGAEEAITLEKGEEMGRFNMGSTVIVIFGPEAVEWSDAIQPAAPVRLGQLLATAKKK